MTSITINCASCTCETVRPALDVEQERLRQLEKDKLDRIIEDRQQMNIALEARIASERYHQQVEERSRQTIENTISLLDMVKLVDKELQDTIAEPPELIGESREDSDYENTIKQIKKERANDTRTRQQNLWIESYYWPIIQQHAKMIGLLPPS